MTTIRKKALAVSMTVAMVISLLSTGTVFAADINNRDLTNRGGAEEGFDYNISYGFDGRIVLPKNPGLTKKQTVIYKFTVPANPGAATLEMTVNSSLRTSYSVAFYKDDMKTQALTAQNFADEDDFKPNSWGAFSYSDLDTNCYFKSDRSRDDGIAKVSFYKPGTYYMKVIYLHENSSGSEFVAFDNLKFRPYRQITGLQLENGRKMSLIEGNTSEFIDEFGNLKKRDGIYYSNRIISMVPADADGFIKQINISGAKSFIKPYSAWDYPEKIEKFDVNSGLSYSRMGLCDERGVLVTDYLVERIPADFGSIKAEGKTKSVSFFDKQSYISAADQIKVYLYENGKYVPKYYYLKGGSNSAYNIPNLKAGKNYKIKVAYYDSKTGVEGKAAAFTVGTAPSGKPVIKSVSNKKISKRKGTLTHNPGKWSEWRESYTYYALTAKVKLKSKVSGATGYEINGTTTKSLSTTLQLAKAGSKSALKKGTTKITVKAVRKVNSYCTAYGTSVTKKIKNR